MRASRDRRSLNGSIKFENSLEKTHKSGFPFNSRDSLVLPPSLMAVTTVVTVGEMAVMMVVTVGGMAVMTVVTVGGMAVMTVVSVGGMAVITVRFSRWNGRYNGSLE